MNDPQPIAVPPAPVRLDLQPIAAASPSDWTAAAIEARQIGAAGALQELRQHRWPADALAQAALDRCDTLLERSRTAVAAGSRFVALDCLMQFERERLALVGPSLRAAWTQRLLADARGAGARDEALWSAVLRQADLSDVATAQAVFDVAHARWRAQMQRSEAQQECMRALAPLALASLLFYVLWALLGGFDWLARDDVDVTTGMLMVAGAMSGWLGAVLGLALRVGQDTAALGLRAQRWWSVARAALGAIVAVPIVLLAEAGFVDLAQVPAAVIVLACFMAAVVVDRSITRRTVSRAP